MAHASYEELSDLESVLEAVRGWDGVKERKPGVFYLRSRAFLHFHTKGERRWADARAGADWGPELEIPRRSTAAQRTALLEALEEAYRATLAAPRR